MLKIIKGLLTIFCFIFMYLLLLSIFPFFVASFVLFLLFQLLVSVCIIFDVLRYEAEPFLLIPGILFFSFSFVFIVFLFNNLENFIKEAFLNIENLLPLLLGLLCIGSAFSIALFLIYVFKNKNLNKEKVNVKNEENNKESVLEIKLKEFDRYYKRLEEEKLQELVKKYENK